MYETAEKTDTRAKKAACGSRAELAQLEHPARGRREVTYREQAFRQEPDVERKLTQAEDLFQRALEDRLRGAYSIESRAGHEPGLERLPVMLIGTVFREAAGRKYELYEDTEGNLWYQVRIWKNGEWLTETEAVFGKEKRKGSG